MTGSRPFHPNADNRLKNVALLSYKRSDKSSPVMRIEYQEKSIAVVARSQHRLPHPLVELSPIDATNSAVQLVHIEILFTVSSEMRCTASQLQRTVSSYPNRRRRGKRDARVVVAHIEMFVERRSKSGKAPSALHRGENRNTRCILSLRTVER